MKNPFIAPTIGIIAAIACLICFATIGIANVDTTGNALPLNIRDIICIILNVGILVTFAIGIWCMHKDGRNW